MSSKPHSPTHPSPLRQYPTLALVGPLFKSRLQPCVLVFKVATIDSILSRDDSTFKSGRGSALLWRRCSTDITKCISLLPVLWMR